MAGSVTILKKSPELKSQDYTHLRNTGLEIIRSVAVESWTDHNFHDPGITLLEAFCYAITELGLKSGVQVADLLESGKVHAAPEFFSAAQVLPVAPVTIADYRKILIDHPLVRNAWLSDVDVIPKGRYDVLLEFADDVINEFRFTETIVTAIAQYLVEITLPHWDESEVIPLRTNVALQSAVFDPGAWNPIEGSDAWFNRIQLGYQPLIGPVQTTPLWVVVRVITPMTNPIAELPLILQATGILALTLGNNSPLDQTLLKRYQRRVIMASETTSQVARYLRDYRNLGEYFHDFRSARLQEIAFSATIELIPGMQPEELLADVFLEIDQTISPAITFDGLHQLGELSSDQIFDGPMLDHGFLADSKSISVVQTDHLYTSDFVRIIFQQGSKSKSDVDSRTSVGRDVVAVRDISLSNFLDSRSITSGAKDCLRLVDSKRHILRFSPDKCRIFFYRDGIEVQYDHARVIQLFNEKKLALESSSTPGSADISVPAGEAFDVARYYPVQNDLPLVYGVGEAGLPEHATTSRKAQAKQLKGYLVPIEQLLAGYASQLEHINLFFSSDPEMNTTIFQQPLYHLPGIQDVLKAFDPSTTNWPTFITDDNNDYISTLDTKSETKDQFLDRRNRMLDHLLARLGENMDDLVAQELRYASAVPGAATMTLSQLLSARLARKRNALQRLIGAKSDFYRDLSLLQHRKLQSYGNVLWHSSGFVSFQSTSNGILWQLRNRSGSDVLEQITPAANISEARRFAAVAMTLASQTANFAIVPEGGQQRLLIRTTDNATIARSVQTFANVPAAQAAIIAIAQEVRSIWSEFALSSMERRLYHLIPVRSKHRRTLIHPLNEFFEILNDPAGGVQNEKIFRLWEQTGFGGAQLLRSEGNFPGATNALAIAQAETGVREVMVHGIYTDQYTIEGNSPTLSVVLRNSGNTIIARSDVVFADFKTARAEINRISAHIYHYYSVEGLYLLEHTLLFSQTATPLEITSAGKDPYSFQLSLVLPSGFVRDFTTSVRTPDQPDRYRDTEFRKHAERMIRRSCPAHLLARVFWVDRAVPGTLLAGTEPCFDLFEIRYLAWLEAYLTDRVDASVIDPLRNQLIQTLNAIILEAETSP